MDNQELMQLQAEINNIKFKGCENVKVGDVLYYNLNTQIGILEIVRGLLRMLRNEITDSYEYKIYGMPNTIFLFSNSYITRKDHLATFEKVCETADDYVKIAATKRHLTMPADSLFLALIWVKQFKKLGKSIAWRISMASRLQQCYCDYRYVFRYLEKNRIELLNMVSLCDVMPVDDFFVQMCNSLGIRTVTLQHGIFYKGEHAYTNSKSDYFLAHNLFSKNNAIKSGISEDKVYIVGMPQLIGVYSKNVVQRKNNGIIGVVLSGGENCEPYDIELVNMVKGFKQKYNCKIYVKFHPGYGANKYSKSLLRGIDEIYEEEISAYDFSEKVDFTVDAGSSLFVEYTLRQEISFTFLCDVSPYIEHDIEMGFSSYEEMEKLFLLYKKDFEKLSKMMEHVREYFSIDAKPSELYRRFFETKLLR